MRNQLAKANGGQEAPAGGFYAVISPSKKLQEDKLLPVALMTSIAVTFIDISAFLATC